MLDGPFEVKIKFASGSAVQKDQRDRLSIAFNLVANMLTSLNHRMGQIKDGMYFMGSSAKSLDQPTSIDPKSKKLIEQFLELMNGAFTT